MVQAVKEENVKTKKKKTPMTFKGKKKKAGKKAISLAQQAQAAEAIEVKPVKRGPGRPRKAVTGPVTPKRPKAKAGQKEKRYTTVVRLPLPMGDALTAYSERTKRSINSFIIDSVAAALAQAS